MIGFIYTTVQDPNDRDFMLWVYGEFKNLMYSTAYKYTSKPDAADDIVQDALVNLIKKVDTLRPMKRHILAGYIVATIRNRAINELKSRAYQQENIMDYSESAILEDFPLDRLMILAEQRAQLGKIWTRLSDEDRFLLEGRYILGYTDQEMAESLRCKPDSIRMKLTRARRKALTFLLEEGGDCYE